MTLIRPRSSSDSAEGTTDAASPAMLPMLPSDRAILRNIVIVVLASTGAATLLGMSCLNRGILGQDDGHASIRSSAGGIPLGPPGVASITSFDVPPADQPGPVKNRPLVGPRPQNGPQPNRQPDRQPDVAPPAPPSPMRDGVMPPSMYSAAPYARPSVPYMQLPDGGVVPIPPNMMPPNMTPPNMTPPNTMPPHAPVNIDAGAAAQQQAAPPPPAPPPPRFATEAPPWAASNYQANPEAGAGQFITDTPQPQPPVPPPPPH